jgi:translation initiation factor IF-2
MLLVQLTQQMMGHRLMLADYPQATILEVKTIDGLGTTVDIVLVNGQINEGDTIVACGMQGPIVTQVRALLTPPVTLTLPTAPKLKLLPLYVTVLMPPKLPLLLYCSCVLLPPGALTIPVSCEPLPRK